MDRGQDVITAKIFLGGGELPHRLARWGAYDHRLVASRGAPWELRPEADGGRDFASHRNERVGEPGFWLRPSDARPRHESQCPQCSLLTSPPSSRTPDPPPLPSMLAPRSGVPTLSD